MSTPAPKLDGDTPETGPDRHQDRISMGERLRQIRKEHNWTLAEVAERSGLAVSTVSKVERGLMSLAYDRFMQLSKGLEVDVGELFTPTGEAFAPKSFSVTRASEAQHHETGLYDYEILSADLRNKQMVPMMGRIRAHDVREFDEFVRHTGEEFLIVLDGTLQVHVEGREPVTLGAHDSIYFDSGMGHLYVSAGDTDATIVVVCWQPNVGSSRE